MGTKDISRSMFDSKKHYTGKWTLQGRLITDFDENDREAIAAHERRRSLLDVIGTYGSPDEGFRVDNVRAVGGMLEFDLLAGTLYLGGLRLEQEDPSTYRTQPDQLQLADHPAANGQNRRDLVLLEATEWPVTGEEDRELVDPAVGVDTSARSRRFQRIHVLTDVGAQDCSQAWQLMADILAGTHAGTLGPDLRQVVDTRLTVTYTDEGVDNELCEPPLTGGYLDAENQALRVQLVDDRHLTWGYDNAASLFRVSLSADRTRISLITPPRDLYGTPVVGQVIEILPWAAVLPNGEKTAAVSGHLTRITAVDPSDEAAGGAVTLTLADAVPVGGFDDWQNRPDAAALGAGSVYFYMHIWNRGSDITSPPAMPFTPGTPVTLGTTGIQVTITGTDAVGDDYWVIGARPETPTQVYPWALEEGAPPAGMHRYFAPLALIRWREDGSVSVSDCRPPFRPLTAIDGCCSYSVGDGRISDGDFNDLNTALARLDGNGGEICLLAGVHQANVSLIGRSNITISGCGARSKLIPMVPDGGPVIHVHDCAGIRLRNFEIISVDGSGIHGDRVDGFQIEGMKVLAYRVGMDIDDSVDVTIADCTVRMLDKEGGDVGIFAQAERLCIQDCDIQVIPGGDLPEVPDDGDEETPPVDPTDPCAEPEEFYANLLYLVYYVEFMWGIFTFHSGAKDPYLTLGGIQIGSGSEEVLVRRNLIIGGAGNGITLGSDIADVVPEELQPPPGSDVEQPTVQLGHDFETARGKVILGNDTIGGMTLSFVDAGGNVFAFPVDAGGNFEGKLPPGEYTVSVSDSDLTVVEIEPLGRGDYYVFVREQENPAPRPRGGADLLAFLHQVTLEDNRIANMGFSGIGAPRFTSADAVALRDFGFATRAVSNRSLLLLVYAATGTITGFVVDLTIYRNTITHCLQNAPLANVDQFAVERALGGISLALCNGVAIEENVIRECGRGAEMPVCGIFISFSVDVTIRENQILNNGQDRRAEQAIAELVEAPDLFVAAPTGQPAAAEIGGMDRRTLNYTNNRYAYERYRVGVAAGSLSANVPEIEFGRGPRAAILLPICLSANLFAGGAAQKGTASLNVQGLTGAAEGRHAARIDGNYVVQPFGKSLFVGAAGSLSITDNQLISDRALPRELDALAGGLSGRLAAAFVIGPVDLFAANVMVVDICPGAYIVDTLKLVAREGQMAHADTPSAQLTPTPIPYGFPDGNVLFAGNQIKQGDAGARPTLVTVLTMDDVNFVDNQIDVLNATDVRSTAIVFGVTARAANNRMKEPVLLALRPSTAGAVNEASLQRYSLLEVGMLAGGMINNQGNYCLKLFIGTNNGAEFANLGLLASLMKCDERLMEQLPEPVVRAMLVLLSVSAQFAQGLSKLGQ